MTGPDGARNERNRGRTLPADPRQPSGGKASRGARRPARLALSNWPVSTRLAAVFAVASVAGLVLGGLRVADAVGTSAAYDRTAQLATLGEQATGLAQALQDERDLAAGVAAYRQLQSGAAASSDTAAVGLISSALTREKASLTAAEQVTDTDAGRTKALASAIGPGFTPGVQAKAASVVTMIYQIPALRDKPAGHLVTDYAGSIAVLYAADDEIASGSGDAVLADDVRALGAMSRAKDEASQQRAILYGALIEASGDGTTYRVAGPRALTDSGGLSALISARALQAADVTAFDDAATAAQAQLYLATVADPRDKEAGLVEEAVLRAGDPRVAFEPVGATASPGLSQATVAKLWYSDASTMISQLGTIESQLASTVASRGQSLAHQALVSAALTAAATVAAVLLVLLATVLIGRTLVRPLRRLQTDALEIAAVRLPERVAAAAGAEADDSPDMVDPIGVRSTDEIGRVARAFDQVHAEAVRLAGNEARLRGSVNSMFISLSRRSVPLIDRLARMIDSMEQNEGDPDQLADLFAMDHLVTRMRRNSENLLVLAGEEPVRKWTEPVPLTDVARAAASEIEQYSRVALTVGPGIMISGQAAADVVHLLAELIENATLFSAKDTQVRVTVTEISNGGALVEVRDDGVGVSPGRLADMNWRLDHPPVVDVSVSRHMGLYAVARLAARYGIRVKLRSGQPQGLAALVWLPGNLIRHEEFRPRGGDEQRPGPRRGAPTGPGRRADQDRSTAAWFAAKRPAAGRPPVSPPVGTLLPGPLGPTTGGLPRRPPERPRPDPSGLPRRAAELSGSASGPTTGGLPRRVPGARHPGADTPGWGQPAVPNDATIADPVADTVPDHGVLAGAAPLGAPVPDRAPPRRTPEAARNRLAGFQLGNRDGVQAVRRAGGPPPAEEENGR